jgi:hypothetical protein
MNHSKKLEFDKLKIQKRKQKNELDVPSQQPQTSPGKQVGKKKTKKVDTGAQVSEVSSCRSETVS